MTSQSRQSSLTVIVVLVVALLFAIAGIAVAILGQRLTLTTKTDLNIYSDFAPGYGEPVGSIAKGTTVPVIGCVDRKSTFEFQVITPDGQVGYVGVGDFELSHGKVLSSYLKAPITFGCP